MAAASVITKTVLPELKNNKLLDNFNEGLKVVDGLLKNVSVSGVQAVVTEAMSSSLEKLVALQAPLGDLGTSLVKDLKAKLPVGAKITGQLVAELPSALNKLRVQISKGQFSVSDKSMAELAALQASRVAEAWKEIKASQKLAEKSSEKIKAIDERLTVMEDYCTKIRKMLSASESDTFTEAQKKTIVGKMKSLYLLLRSDYITVSNDINALKLDIDGQMIRLDHQDQLQNDLIMQNTIVGVAGIGKAAYNQNWEGLAEVGASALGKLTENFATKLAISSAKEHLEQLMNQVKALEERLVKVTAVKKEAEAFLAENGVDVSKL